MIYCPKKNERSTNSATCCTIYANNYMGSDDNWPADNASLLKKTFIISTVLSASVTH